MLSRKTVDRLAEEAGVYSETTGDMRMLYAQRFARLVEVRVLENAAKNLGGEDPWGNRRIRPYHLRAAARSARKAAHQEENA